MESTSNASGLAYAIADYERYLTLDAVSNREYVIAHCCDMPELGIYIPKTVSAFVVFIKQYSALHDP